MNYLQFIEEVKDRFGKTLLPEQKLSLQTIKKNNGTVLDGLVVVDPTINISPTIYLNPYYHRYLEGMSFEEIIEDIKSVYQNFAPTENFDITIFTDYEKASQNIIMKLINYEKNTELLQDVPHIRFLDLAIVFACAIYNLSEEYGTILIHNSHLKYWNVTTERLYEVAQKNSPVLLPYSFENMTKYLEKSCNLPITENSLPLYILTNESKIYGASVILYEHLLEDISEQLNSSLVIIPSSIHEVLILPENTKENINDYNSMVSNVNETQLTDDEILSDHVYFYSKETKQLN